MKRKKVIIFIKGLCGSGKTTLSELLSWTLPAKVFRIGDYRNRKTLENDSWENMVADIEAYSKAHTYTIVETTGVNYRESLFLRLANSSEILKFALNASLEVLDKRIDQKPLLKRGGRLGSLFNYFPFKEYKNKKDFNRKMQKQYKRLLKSKDIIKINVKRSKVAVYTKVLVNILAKDIL